MPRQAVDARVERGEMRRAGMLAGQAGHFHLRLEIERVREVAVREKAGEALHDIGGEIERLADLAHRAAPAVGDDVRGHRRAVFSVAPIHLLDHALAPVAARQVEVDVRPALAPLAEEALEKQLGFHRVHGGDAEAVADRGVRRAAAALHHDVFRAAEIHDVPHDEKVTREAEPPDQIKLVPELAGDAAREPSVAAARAGERFAAEEILGGCAVGQRVAGKFVAEIFERKLEPLGEARRVRDGVGEIVEELAHRTPVEQRAAVVAREEAARGVEMRVLADAGENVEHLAVGGRVVEHAVGREQWQTMRCGERGELGVDAIFSAHAVPLDLHENTAPPKRGGELFQNRTRRRVITERAVERAFLVARQRDEAGRKFREFVPAHGARVLAPAEPRASDETAEILVARM